MSFVALAELTWADAAELRERDDVVGLVPTGAVEQHGPHLPLATDFLIAEQLARAVAEALPVPVVVAPVLAGGLSDHHLAFPGTVTLSRDVFGGWIDAQVAAFERMGIGRVAVFSAHGGNFAFLGELAARYAEHGGAARVIAYDDLLGFVKVMDEAARSLGLEAPETDVHAGALETSVALTAFPTLVRDFTEVEGYTAAEDGWMERIWQDGLDALAASGVLGDPRLATAEAGRAVFDALVRELTGWISRELEIPLER
jgi:creatinine amidohydrolase